ARALVFPSLFEGFGLPVVEAMASGLPVACARIPALQEVGGEAVLCFDPRDIGDIQRALREVWSEEATRRRLRLAGQERAEQYRWPRLVPRLLEVYGRAAGGRA
ncbi:MAG TPA: glycosyltransferase, partial [Vicinamibacteria bacterium]|nr:glycosyltransferase [Vicinamibacteria bacterium]